ncbi:MAG: fasciclin domain-containing protein [Chloroflexi bacterium]|nr:fasciclin domain-containing protein [Chloroflexota bacterium]
MTMTNLFELASASGEFDLFVAALEATRLDCLLAEDRSLTVLAPTDAAFGGVSDAVLAHLVDRRSADLASLVRSHVVRGAFQTADLVGCGWLETLSGVRLPVDALGELLVIGGAVLVRPDLVGANGVLHGIDQVLPARPYTLQRRAKE